MLVSRWYLGDGVLSGDSWHDRLQFAVFTTTYGRVSILSGDLERRQWPWRSSCGGSSGDRGQLGSWSSVTAALVQVETLFVVQHRLIQCTHQLSNKSLEFRYTGRRRRLARGWSCFRKFGRFQRTA